MVHTYSLNGYHIALDVYSGAVHVCDPVYPFWPSACMRINPGLR